MKMIDTLLKIRVPSEEANELDFSSKSDDVLESVSHFNDKFRDWNKRIIVVNISKRTIRMLLVIENEKQDENLSAREMRLFTSYLTNNKGWKMYSKDKNKMFECVNFKAIHVFEAQALLSKMAEADALYVNQKLDIQFINEYAEEQSMTENDSDVNITDMMHLSDDDACAIFQYLIKTQHIGANQVKKQITINKLKELLITWA